MSPVSESRFIRNCSLIFLCAISFVCGDAVLAASFDCRNVQPESHMEYLICNIKELSDLDEKLGVAYKNAIVKGTAHTQIKKEQLRWLHEVRPMCNFDTECLKEAYTSRIKELTIGPVRKVKGTYECSDGERFRPAFPGMLAIATQGVSLIFTIKNGNVEKFSSLWVEFSTSPDLRSPYQNICNVELESLEQIKNDNFTVLRYRDPINSKKTCEVRIFETAKSIHVYPYACNNSCIRFDLELPKDGKTCRQIH